MVNALLSTWSQKREKNKNKKGQRDHENYKVKKDKKRKQNNSSCQKIEENLNETAYWKMLWELTKNGNRSILNKPKAFINIPISLEITKQEKEHVIKKITSQNSGYMLSD